MPTALADFRTRIRNMLVDTSSARYPNAQLDEALRQSLSEYSDSFPQVLTASVTVATAGRIQSLATLTAPRQVLSILFPYSASADPDTLNYGSWYFYIEAAVPKVHITGPNIPQVGQILYLTYTSPHTIKDLDSAGTTSLVPAHDTYLTIGAAALCAIQRGSALIEAFTSRSSDVAQLIAWGNNQLIIYRKFLSTLKSASFPPGQLPGLWKLDQWDK
jgi:hypothetical protein